MLPPNCISGLGSCARSVIVPCRQMRSTDFFSMGADMPSLAIIPAIDTMVSTPMMMLTSTIPTTTAMVCLMKSFIFFFSV